MPGIAYAEDFENSENLVERELLNSDWDCRWNLNGAHLQPYKSS